MAINNIIQPKVILIDESLRLKKTEDSSWKVALQWYQNPRVLYFSEGVTDKVYDMETVYRMYKYLDSIGELYFIEVLEGEDWKAVGDVTLSEENMPIAIGDESYWGKGIGKRVIEILISRAKDIGLKRLYIPSIYVYNHRSQNLFKSLGFKEVKSNEKERSLELIL